MVTSKYEAGKAWYLANFQAVKEAHYGEYVAIDPEEKGNEIVFSSRDLLEITLKVAEKYPSEAIYTPLVGETALRLRELPAILDRKGIEDVYPSN